MMLKSILPFIAILLFLIALVLGSRRRHRRIALLSRSAGALGWLCFAGYCYFSATGYIAGGEYFDASMSVVFLLFAVALALLLVRARGEEILPLFSVRATGVGVGAVGVSDMSDELVRGMVPDRLKGEFRANGIPAPSGVRMMSEHEWLLLTDSPGREYIVRIEAQPGNGDGDDGGDGMMMIYKNRSIVDILFAVTKIAFIAAVLYFPFSEVTAIGDGLIYATAKITTLMLNHLNWGTSTSVYLVPPSYIYTTERAFHEYELYKPIEIILACTAIQSIVLFSGLIFGVESSLRRKVEAFMVSVPVIYGLNILRNMFVCEAYFGGWFGSPPESFYIAHGVIARIGVFISLVIIAYAVFVIIPEALDLVEDFIRVIFLYLRRIPLLLFR